MDMPGYCNMETAFGRDTTTPGGAVRPTPSKRLSSLNATKRSAKTAGPAMRKWAEKRSRWLGEMLRQGFCCLERNGRGGIGCVVTTASGLVIAMLIFYQLGVCGLGSRQGKDVRMLMPMLPRTGHLSLCLTAGCQRFLARTDMVGAMWHVRSDDYISMYVRAPCRDYKLPRALNSIVFGKDPRLRSESSLERARVVDGG
jgi:hypothetical protein